jgi:hypothetical protein
MKEVCEEDGQRGGTLSDNEEQYGEQDEQHNGPLTRDIGPATPATVSEADGGLADG